MERMTRFRATVLVLVLSLILSFFSWKLYDGQVTQGEVHGNNITTYTTRTRVRAARGEILDANGNKLVGNRVSYDLAFNHYVILNSGSPNQYLLALVELCNQLDARYVDHFPLTEDAPFAYTLAEQSTAWQGYFQKFLKEKGGLDSDMSPDLLMAALRDKYDIPEEWTHRQARAVLGLRYELSLRNGITNLPNFVFMEDVSKEIISEILELNTPGLNVEESTVRQYYTSYGAHVLGYIGAMDKDQLAYYTDLGYPMDALVGQSGFEKAFEEHLHGTDGVRVDKVTKDGTVVESYYETVPKAGNNVEVSLNLLMQMAAEDALAETIENLRNPETNTSSAGRDAEGGAVVAIDVKTGQVLVCGSYPTYDLSNLRQDYEQIAGTQFAPLLNRALMATYPPGSTYKMAMVTAGVNNQIIRPSDTIYDEGVFKKYDGFSASCLAWSNGGYSHQHINCMEALKVSCNYFFYELADRMSIDMIDETAKAFGLGEKTGVELFEYLGTRANALTKAELFAGTTDSGWYPADQIMTGIGQSFNSFTPMQLAVYTSTLCNQGTRYKATFLNKVVSGDYSSVIYENTVQVMSTLKISDEAFNAYSMGMEMVANEVGGTAYSAFYNYPIRIAAKTGTAEVAGGSDNGSFVCYAPADDPQIAVVVYGERAGGGSRLANVAKAILDVYFGIHSGEVDNWENQVN